MHRYDASECCNVLMLRDVLLLRVVCAGNHRASVEKNSLPLEVFEARQADRKLRVLEENASLFAGHKGGGKEAADVTDSARKSAVQPDPPAVLPAWVDNAIRHPSAPGNEAHDTTASDQFYPNSTPPTVSNDQHIVYVNGQRWISTKAAAAAPKSGADGDSGGSAMVSACVGVSCKCIVMMHRDNAS